MIQSKYFLKEGRQFIVRYSKNKCLNSKCIFPFSKDVNQDSHHTQSSEDNEETTMIIQNSKNEQDSSSFFKEVDYVGKEKFLVSNFYSLLQIGASVGIGSLYENIYILGLSLPGLYKINKSQRVVLQAVNMLKQKLSNYDVLYNMLITKMCLHPRTQKYFSLETLCVKDSLLSPNSVNGKEGYIYEFTFFDVKSGAYGYLKADIEYSSKTKFSSNQIEITFEYPEKWRGIIEDPHHTINIM